MPARAELLLPPPIDLNRDQLRQIEEYDYTQGPEFSEATDPVDLKVDRLQWGRSTDALYEGRYKRFPPHMVMGDSIIVFGRIKPTPIGHDQPTIRRELDLREHGLITVHEITAETLLREQLAQPVIDVLLIDKRVEDNLQWFLIHAKNAFKDIKGLARQYGQWDREEAEHSNIAGLILRTAGGMTQEELDADYEMTQRNSWKPPFKKDIEMVIYAMMQERNTNENYKHLADAMKATDAVNSAFATRLIASDEQVHGDSYEKDAEAYARISPQHAIEAAQAALDVAFRFRMPSLALMRDRMRDTKLAMDTVGYRIEEVQDMLRGVLRDLTFVPNHLIDPVVDAYGKAEPRRIARILIAQRHEQRKTARLPSRNGGESVSESNGHQGLTLPPRGEIFTPQA